MYGRVLAGCNFDKVKVASTTTLPNMAISIHKQEKWTTHLQRWTAYLRCNLLFLIVYAYIHIGKGCRPFNPWEAIIRRAVGYNPSLYGYKRIQTRIVNYI